MLYIDTFINLSQRHCDGDHFNLTRRRRKRRRRLEKEQEEKKEKEEEEGAIKKEKGEAQRGIVTRPGSHRD